MEPPNVCAKRDKNYSSASRRRSGDVVSVTLLDKERPCTLCIALPLPHSPTTGWNSSIFSFLCYAAAAAGWFFSASLSHSPSEWTNEVAVVSCCSPPEWNALNGNSENNENHVSNLAPVKIDWKLFEGMHLSDDIVQRWQRNRHRHHHRRSSWTSLPLSRECVSVDNVSQL